MQSLELFLVVVSEKYDKKQQVSNIKYKNKLKKKKG